MKIEKDRVVRFHYTLFEGGAAEQGRAALESSEGREPMAILFGHGNIIPGLEKAMDGRDAGERFEVDVVAAEAYGQRHEGFLQRVPKKHFGRQPLAPGLQVMLQTNQGPRLATVQKVGMSVVDVDMNHPMAGKDLRFAIEILEVREASAEELAHGHVHGEGGHQH